MRPTEILRRERGWEVKSWRQETSQETAVTSWQGLTRLGHGQGRWEWAEDPIGGNMGKSGKDMATSG